MKKRCFAIWFLSLLCLPLLAGRYNTDSGLYGDWESWFYNSYENGTYAEWPISGAGTQNDPYRIESETHLACLAYWVNRKEWTGEGKYFTLTTDLDMGYRRWIPIGVDKDHPFRGYFRGGNHTIRDITINVVTGDDSKSYYYGLFGYCEAIISDLNVSEVSININQDNHEFSTRWLCAGLLCGELSYYRGTNLTIYGAIYNCNASGSINGEIGDTGTRSSLGGLVGYADNPVSIYHCHTNLTSNLKGAFDVGGIVGYIHGYDFNFMYYWKHLTDNGGLVPLETFVYDCTADVNLTVTKDEIDYYHAGGICGTNEGNIEACASSGSVTAGTDGTAAGICGRNMGNIIACVSMVTATGGYNVGGIVGKNESRSMNGKTFNAQIHDCVFSGHLDGTNSTYCGGLAARSSEEDVINSLCLGTIQASTSSNYTSPLHQSTDGIRDDPVYCHYDRNLLNYLEYEHNGIAMTNYVLTGGTVPSFDDEEKLTSMKNVYYNESRDDVRAIEWVCADGFYPRLTISNTESSNAKTGTLSDNVITRALTVTGQDDTNFFRATLLPNYAWLTSVPACLTSGQFAYHVDNSLTMTSKSDNEHTATYSLPTGQTVLTISESTATPAESGYVMLTISDAATSLSKQMLLNVVHNNRQWNGTFFTTFDGEGTELNPYLIHNAGQFARIILQNEANTYYKLTQDIWFNDDLLSDTGTPKDGKYKWNRNSATDAFDWKGHLNGDGHAVHGMWLDNSFGIFTTLVGDASIENIAFVNTYVGTPAPGSGYLWAALFAERVSGNAVIRNCLVDGVLGRKYNNMTTSGVFAELLDNGNPQNVQYATIEDCVFSISGHYAVDNSGKPAINFAFAPVAAPSMGRIHRVLLLNNGEPSDGIGTTNPSAETFENSKLYYPTGYMDGYTPTESYYGGLSVAAMTNGTLFANEDKWVSVEGRFPMLKSFADTDYGKLLALPIYTVADNTLETLELITDFERGAANWKMADTSVINVISDLELMEPLRAERTHLVRTLGEAKILTPITVISGFTPGIPFEDNNTNNFCVAAFDSNHDGKVNLTEVMGVNSSAFETAMAAQSTYANAIQKFPELRYFKSVDDLNTVFRDKANLKEVTLPAKIRTLDNDLFYGCSSLASFTIPVSITSLGASHPFNGSAIENFSTEKRHPTMEARGGVLMTKEGNQLVCYPNGRTDADITLSGIVERINSNAIYKVNGATNIYLDAPDYNSFTDLAEGGITSYNNGDLMTIYVKDATNELTEDERRNALTGEGKGYLLEQFKGAECWSAYKDAGKLKRYFELDVSANSLDAGNSCYWATMYIGFDTQLPEGLTAYIVDKEKTSESSATLVLRKINSKVPMLTPVVIQAAAAGKYKLYPSVESKLKDIPMYDNLLEGTGRDGLKVNQSQAIDGGCLTLGRNSQGKVGFFIYKGTKKIPPYRAYLSVNKVSSSRLLEILDDEPTGLNEELRMKNEESASAWYTLDGRKLDGKPTTKGLYIVNGRKEVVR